MSVLVGLEAPHPLFRHPESGHPYTYGLFSSLSSHSTAVIPNPPKGDQPDTIYGPTRRRVRTLLLQGVRRRPGGAQGLRSTDVGTEDALGARPHPFRVPLDRSSLFLWTRWRGSFRSV